MTAVAVVECAAMHGSEWLTWMQLHWCRTPILASLIIASSPVIVGVSGGCDGFKTYHRRYGGGQASWFRWVSVQQNDRWFSLPLLLSFFSPLFRLFSRLFSGPTLKFTKHHHETKPLLGSNLMVVSTFISFYICPHFFRTVFLPN